MPVKEAQKRININRVQMDAGDGIGTEVIFWTDPLCCWSWAMEAEWARFQREYGSSLRVTYRMIGLLPSWDQFNDSLSSLSRPVHMGPEWMQAGRIAGLPVADKIWVTDPPSSSFPACIAVKCAEDQSPGFGGIYLKVVREALIEGGENIANTNVLIEVAERVSVAEPSFDGGGFRRCLLGPRGAELFRGDYQQAQYLGIRRSPTLVFKKGGLATMVRGYQSGEALWDAANSLG